MPIFKKINIGLVYVGQHAIRNIIPSLLSSPNYNIVGIYFRNLNKEKRKNFNMFKLYSDYTEVLQDKDLDCIYISSPNSSHFELSLKALKNYKHVICEKPLATNLTDISKLMICLTYGPHQNLNRLVPYTINALSAAKGPIKLKLNRPLDILFVDDVINALLKAGLMLKHIKPIYIGTNQPSTVKDVTTLIAELMNKDPQSIEFESDNYKYDTILNTENIGDAKTSLDWTPSWSLTQGLEKTIDWYVKEGRH